MGNLVRLRLLPLIASRGGEGCVCEPSEEFDLTVPTISHHLKVLREAGLITGPRRGTWIYYRIEPDTLQVASAVLAPDDRTGQDRRVRILRISGHSLTPAFRFNHS
jgi:ArsR family transcriptional regulator